MCSMDKQHNILSFNTVLKKKSKKIYSIYNNHLWNGKLTKILWNKIIKTGDCPENK